MFDAAEEALDQVAVLVLVAIERPLDDAMAAWRDDGFDPLMGEVLKDGVGIVGLVRTEGERLQFSQQWQCLRAVAGFTAGQAESGKRSQTFHQGVNLRAQSAARAPERLIPFF